MPSPELVIFDCDGVLVDSEIIAARAEAEILAKAGFEITAEDLARDYAGLTFKDILLRIEAEQGLVVQASLIAQAEKLVDQKLAREVRAIEGAAEAAASIRSPKCVCSNSSGERLRLTLGRTGLLPLFADAIYSAVETPSRLPKPHPDVFLHAAAAMNADPKRSFVIEDSIHGVAGATAAGMRVIGFTGASHSQPGHADALTEAGAETVIHRLADLQSVLAALSDWSEDA
ncbi:HAD-IA family hydrolase [Chelativorans sp. ZYF759]|uniref:HAD family hydrolase n=1 Tax=Chelativorans sp. ZYF759 TaxID=2692213 RepID=UPI00145D0C66|nr:HAD-IA family hydrolase [Chelativorans sp. ZYF759]NMG38902.1 HAD-IA family hydrolase [Chelativorans sp. ZYF759]